MSASAFERLELYGFGIDYPKGCQVELNPKSKREGGDVALKSPDGYKVFISWGPMEKIKRFSDTAAHADFSVKNVAKGGQTTINSTTFEPMSINGHGATFTHMKLEAVSRGGLLRTVRSPQEVRSLHIHCSDSSRYFVIYGPAKPEQSEKQDEVLAEMFRSFKCH